MVSKNENGFGGDVDDDTSELVNNETETETTEGEDEHQEDNEANNSRSSSRRSEIIEEQNNIIKKKTVCVVVLGDIGRSPRIRYHAQSLAREGFYVQILCYGGGSSVLPIELTTDPSIWLHFMKEPPGFLQSFPRLISYPLKIIWQWLFLSWAFLIMTFIYQFKPNFILLQNPPAIPTIPLCWYYSKIYRCPFIIDWHNYGYSIMALKTGQKSRIYKLAKWLEDYFGKRADRHLCVTKAMKLDLKDRLGVDAVTLYDKPPGRFKQLSDEERLEFLKRFSLIYPEIEMVINPEPGTKKPGILVSTTSWTEDEDFRILLTALKDYDTQATLNSDVYPMLLVFITGKGPEKEYYKNIIEKMKTPNVKIYLPWLEHEDYPKLLGCADLGVSLHTSSSGLDLPMKVADMFGAGLPVCAINFPAISELVRHEENGLIFNDSTELTIQIQDWFKISKNHKPNMNHKKYRENLKGFQSIRWHENWLFNAAPLFE